MTRYLLDTNILSDLVVNPQSRVAKHLRKVGESKVCTSIVVAAELRYGATKRASARLSQQLNMILDTIDIVALESPVDEIYGAIRTKLEKSGKPIGGNDLLIAAHAIALDTVLVTDNEREFSRVDGLKRENWLR